MHQLAVEIHFCAVVATEDHECGAALIAVNRRIGIGHKQFELLFGERRL